MDCSIAYRRIFALPTPIKSAHWNRKWHKTEMPIHNKYYISTNNFRRANISHTHRERAREMFMRSSTLGWFVCLHFYMFSSAIDVAIAAAAVVVGGVCLLSQCFSAFWIDVCGRNVAEWEKGSTIRPIASIDWYFYSVFIVSVWWHIALGRRCSWSVYDIQSNTIYHMLMNFIEYCDYFTLAHTCKHSKKNCCRLKLSESLDLQFDGKNRFSFQIKNVPE